MNFFGWLYLALLVAVQLIGWFGCGRSSAVEALLVIVVPSSISSGAAFFGFFFWKRSWVLLPPTMLVFIQMGVSYSGRWTPSSGLLRHAMSQFLEREVAGNGSETYLGGALLLLGMLLLAAAAAFGTAEVYRLGTGRVKRGGAALFREAGQSFARWDKKVTGGTGHES